MLNLTSFSPMSTAFDIASSISVTCHMQIKGVKPDSIIGDKPLDRKGINTDFFFLANNKN